MAFLLCTLGILCFALCAVENKEIMEKSESLQLLQDSPFDKLDDTLKSVERLNLMDWIHKLYKYEDEIIPQEIREREKQEKNMKRDAKPGLTTRKPCRVFFWKSWASC